jgi:glutamyl-tRNA synthetase
LPLIHDESGSKLSKRFNAAAVEDYKDMGFLPVALRNYLLKLGFSHGDDEIINDENAIKWFDIKQVNKSPARFDIKKLESINVHYMKELSETDLLSVAESYITKFVEGKKTNSLYKTYLSKGLKSIAERSKTLVDLVQNSSFYILDKDEFLNKEALKNLREYIENNKSLITEYANLLQSITDFTAHNLLAVSKEFALSKGLKLGEMAETIRVCLVGSKVAASSNFQIMEIIGKQETLSRMKQVTL